MKTTLNPFASISIMLMLLVTSFATLATPLAPPPAPLNDEWAGAFPLTIDAINDTINDTLIGTNTGATSSTNVPNPGYGFNNDNDVWYKFTVPTSGHIVICAEVIGFTDGAMALYSESTPGNLTIITGNDDDGNQDMPYINKSGLTPGSTVYVRFWGNKNKTGSFKLIFADGTPPSNDDACGAYNVKLNVGFCKNIINNNLNATTSNVTGPHYCKSGYDATKTKDVWYKLKVPESGKVVAILKKHDYDVSVQFFSGSNCSTLTEIDWKCLMAEKNNPEDSIHLINLTPNSYIWVQVMGYYDQIADFELCLTAIPKTPDCSKSKNDKAADNFPDATMICNLDGYCGNTANILNNPNGYSTDIVGNIDRNLFCGVGTTIDNNSWLKFIAADDSVYLNIFVSGCTGGPHGVQGIQVQLLDYDPAYEKFETLSECFDPKTQKDGAIFATNLTPGKTYYLMVDGNSGDECDYSIKAASGIKEGVDTQDSRTMCSNAGIKLTLPNYIKGTYVWSASPADPNLNGHENEPTPTVTPTAKTTYTAKGVTGTCFTGDTYDIVVDVQTKPINKPNPANFTYCQNELAPTLTATATAPNTLLWYIKQTGGVGTTEAPTPSTATPTSGTPYYYYVCENNNGCEGDRSPIGITVNPGPNPPTVTPTINFCPNTQAVALSVLSGTNPKWYDDATTNVSTTQAPTPSTTTVGTKSYYVTQTAASGCESPRAKIDVVVSTPPKPTVTSPVTLCLNATATALNVAGTNLKWYDAANNPITLTPPATSPTPITTVAGTVSYYVTETTNGCESDKAKLDVTVNALPTITASAKAPANCQLELEALGTGTVLWDANPTDPSLTSTNNTSKNPSVSPLVATEYTVTITDANGCDNSAKVNVTTTFPKPSVTATAASTTISFNSSTTITATPSGAKQYDWSSNPPSLIVTGEEHNETINTTKLIITDSPIVYTVTVTDNNGCANTADASINVTNSTLVINPIPAKTICEGETYTIETTSLTTGGKPPFTWKWTAVPAYNWNSTGTDQSTLENPVVKPTETTDFTLEITDATTPSAQKAPGNVKITVNKKPVVTLPSDYSVCNGETNTSSTFTSVPTGATYAWANSDASIGLSANGTTDNISFTATNATDKPVKAIVTVTPTLNTCVGDTASFKITVLPTPKPNLGQDLISCEKIPLTTGVTADNYKWSTDETSATITTPGAGVYSVTVSNTVTSGDDKCSGTDTITIKYCKVDVPNVITANGDNKNDVFFCVGIEDYPNTALVVFNRWGKKVYENTDYKNDWKGEDLSDGTYYYILTFPPNTLEEATGTVTILKDGK